MPRARFDLPPAPRLRGRRAELATLEAALTKGRLARLALVGGGGSGKSVLAAALAHRLRDRFAGGVAWFRVGNWDHRTLLQMVALRLEAPREPLVESVRRALIARGAMLLVLDNHENDRAMARFLEALEGAPVTWLLTARRCLLSGMAIFPVVAPLVQARRDAFPSVRALTVL
ncbi:MAG TPA: AAA family ATPase, partial [Polyangia bacterium]|nr:AAA family ATPase [Polyangia bacterium]